MSNIDVGIIYFMDNHGDEIKIGFDASGKRIAAHITSGMEPIAVCRGTQIDERELHKELGKFFRKRGNEWYYNDDNLWSYILWLLTSGYAKSGKDPSSLPVIPLSVWIYKPNNRYLVHEDGQYSLLRDPLPVKERVKRFSDEAYNISLSDDWYTDTKWIELARKAMGGIDTDPATCADVNEKIVKARWFFTKESSGLLPIHEWRGNVWLNPPYSRAEEFFKKLIMELEEGRVDQYISCCNANAFSSNWFQDTIAKHSNLIFIPRGRPKFMMPGTMKLGSSPNAGTAFAYGGDNPERFRRIFREEPGSFWKIIRDLENLHQ